MKIRIGTRDSKLALWQAEMVQALLKDKGFDSELVLIKSEGDMDLQTPLYAMGVQGVFTRSLDIALLNNKIDIAVHSMKDVPTQLPAGIVQAAIIERGVVNDLMVFKSAAHKQAYDNGTADLNTWNIATSSIRRKAQLLHYYPECSIHNIRGNVLTRLQKLEQENWDAVIFAQAGLERINARPEASVVLDWMLPAPAQGAVMVVCLDADKDVLAACRLLNHEPTDTCTKIERDFLKTLMGGCSTPISAYAKIEDDKIVFKGSLCSLDGEENIEVDTTIDIADAEDLGILLAQEVLVSGGREIVDSIRNTNNS